MKKPCPYCFNFIERKTEVCPFCKTSLKKDKENTQVVANDECVTTKDGISPNLERLYEENISQSQVDVNEENRELEECVDLYHQKNGRIKWVPKKKRETITVTRSTRPRTSGVHIDVSDVSYFDRSRKNKVNPSPDRILIENDGKYELEKLKWWEIYKWADRQLVRMKLNKHVKKEAIKRPDGVSYGVLFFLCLFTGFLGIHNFYAGNVKRGIVSSVCFSLSFFFVAVLNNIPFFANYFQGLLCALPGLISIVIWVTDFVAIVFRKFKYRKSKMDFIKTLDIETRARLGKKYINIV